MWGRGGWTWRGIRRQAQRGACGRVRALLRRVGARVMRGRESGGVFSSRVHNMISRLRLETGKCLAAVRLLNNAD